MLRHMRPVVRLSAVLLGLTLLGACSSSSEATLSSGQRRALKEVAAAYDRAGQTVRDTFNAEMVVPSLERWQESEFRHQEALGRLRDALPEGGPCRRSIEALLRVEDQQNEIRLRTIDDYRARRFGLVAQDAVAYGASVINGAIPTEAAVGEACGRSTTNASISTEQRASLTPAQDALVSEVLAAYAETRVAFNVAFSLPKFIADLETLQTADNAVASELDDVIASLRSGPCRGSLVEVRRLERQQAALRTRMIAAGRAGDNAEMFSILEEYGRINTTSKRFVAARRSAVEDCGSKL